MIQSTLPEIIWVICKVLGYLTALFFVTFMLNGATSGAVKAYLHVFYGTTDDSADTTQEVDDHVDGPRDS